MKTIQNWNDDWTYIRKDWTEVTLDQVISDANEVTLPHTWYVDGEYYRGDAVYQKVFQIKKEEEQCIFMKCHGVDKICQIYLNGVLVGEHGGAYSLFTVDLTDAYVNDQDNILTVLVNNGKGDTVSPLSGDFTVFGGMHRDVELIITEKAHFDCTYFGTCGVLMNPTVNEDGQGQLMCQPHVVGVDSQDAYVAYEILDQQGQIVVSKKGSIDQSTTILVDQPILWNGKKNPYLYQAKATLYVDHEEKDCVILETGFRGILMDANEGFFLNGTHMKLKGVAKHQDTAGVYSAVTKAHLDQDMALIEEIGANAVRLSHYQHPQYFYDLCDQKGLVVWAEIPMLKMTRNDALFENAKQQLTELILQNIHRPSICFWGLQNEIAIFGEKPYMFERLELLQQHAKSLDTTRYTTGANLNTVMNDSPLNKISDVVAYNVYFGWYYGEMDDFDTFLDSFHQDNPSTCLAISEYGVDCNLKFHTQEPKVKDYTEEFQAKFHETVYPKMLYRDFVWGTFIWNMFDFVSGVRDEGGVKYRNNKGLVTHDRKTPKDSFYYYKAMWSKVPFVHIAEKRFEKRANDQITIKVYSNLKEVTISVNDMTYTQSSDCGVFKFENVSLNMGSNKVVASADGCVDETIFIRVEEPEKDYVFVDPNPGINVKNRFTDEAEREKLFPQDSYSILDVMNDLLDNPEVMALLKEHYPHVSDFMKDTVGTFTLEQGISHAKTLCTEDEVKQINQLLITVKKKG